MILGIDPKVDYVFKVLFGSEPNIPLLINLVNAVLGRRSGELIEWVKILNPFNDKETLDDKLSILDIKARDQLGRLYNIEMQLVAGPDFQKRILYYWSVLYSGQLLAGQDYFELQPTISICFVNNVLYPEVPNYHQEFRLLSAKNTEFSSQLSIHLIELSKLTKQVEELADRMDAWCFFLKNGESLDADNLPKALHFPEVEKAMEVLKVFTQDEIERERYQARLKAQRDHDSLMRYGPREFERGKKEGRSEGVKEGRSEGVKEGRSEGVKEGLVSRIQVYQQLLKLPSKSARELMTLGIAELQSLAKSLESQLGVSVSEP